MQAEINSSLEQTEQLFHEFPKDSQVWIYQSNRRLSTIESQQMETLANQHAQNWKAHGQPINAKSAILFDYFLVFCVNDQTPASGCSIDSSVAFVKQLEQQFGLSFFDRMNIVYGELEDLQIDSFQSIKKGIKEGSLASEIYFFDNSISTLSQLQSSWHKPFKGSWLAPK